MPGAGRKSSGQFAWLALPGGLFAPPEEKGAIRGLPLADRFLSFSFLLPELNTRRKRSLNVGSIVPERRQNYVLCWFSNILFICD